jgi:hypothetical protein
MASQRKRVSQFPWGRFGILGLASPSLQVVSSTVWLLGTIPHVPCWALGRMGEDVPYTRRKATPKVPTPSHERYLFLKATRTSTHHFRLSRKMGFIEIFSFCIAVLAVYGIVIRFLLPRNITSSVATLLNDAQQCLTSAETTGAIPAESEYRARLETYGTLHSFAHRNRLLTDSHSLASDFSRMRSESHRSPGFFQQIWLAFKCGLTYRLYSLASKIRAVKMRVEVRWVTLRFYPTIDKGFTDSNGRASS